MRTTKRPARKPQGIKRGRFVQRSYAAVVWANNPLGLTVMEAWKNNCLGQMPDLNRDWVDEQCDYFNMAYVA